VADGGARGVWVSKSIQWVVRTLSLTKLGTVANDTYGEWEQTDVDSPLKFRLRRLLGGVPGRTNGRVSPFAVTGCDAGGDFGVFLFLRSAGLDFAERSGNGRRTEQGTFLKCSVGGCRKNPAAAEGMGGNLPNNSDTGWGNQWL